MLEAATNPPRTGSLILLVFLQMLPLAFTVGPYAAFLVESFSARIRYTSMSLPFNIGNGWFGGFLPLIATTIVDRSGNRFAWLAYPIGVLVMTLVVGSVFLNDRYRDDSEPT